MTLSWDAEPVRACLAFKRSVTLRMISSLSSDLPSAPQRVLH